jgi:hypothetical protein
MKRTNFCGKMLEESFAKTDVGLFIFEKNAYYCANKIINRQIIAKISQKICMTILDSSSSPHFMGWVAGWLVHVKHSRLRSRQINWTFNVISRTPHPNIFPVLILSADAHSEADNFEFGLFL